MKLYRSEFDSEIFGVDWFKLKLDVFDQFNKINLCRKIIESNAGYVETKIRASNIYLEKSLKEIGFRKISVQPTFQFQLTNSKNHKIIDKKYLKEILDIETIERISNKNCNLFRASRFNLDEKLDLRLVKKHMKKWIYNSLQNKTYYKYIINDSFCTLKKHNNDMIIDLIGVCVEQQHQGIGTRLLKMSIENSINIGAINLIATTEFENTKSVLFYLKHGFHICNTNTVLHLDVADLCT